MKLDLKLLEEMTSGEKRHLAEALRKEMAVLLAPAITPEEAQFLVAALTPKS